MFHVDSASTGEPPTVSSDDVPRSSEPSSTASSVINPPSDFAVNPQGTQVTGTVVQEPDSGYEASPSSTAGNSSFNFDRVQADTEAEYDDSVMTFQMDDEVSQLGSEDERGNCLEVARIDCHRCGALCFCYYSISSITNSSGVSRISDDGRIYRNSELSGGRPSSLPIAIPLRSSLTGYLPLCSPMTRSNPVSGQQTSERRLYQFPLSWPSIAVLGAARGRWRLINRPLWENIDFAESNRNRRAAPIRDRRRLIDSDASSLSSSEGDGPEDVFDAEEDSLPSLSANAFGLPAVSSAPRQQPLPDLVQAHTSRRSRSVSVNLPVDRVLADTIVEVGRSLRRLSDEFSRQRQAARGGASNRRFTIGDFVHYQSSGTNSNRNDDSV